MPLSMDHVVIAVANLDAAIADYTALGFTVLPGGEHIGGATRNALIVFQDGAYIELITFNRPDPRNRWSEVFERAGEGFLDFALNPSDTAADVAAARARGLDLSLPVPGGRTRPDGERLEWQIARTPRSDLPFLCGDVTPRRLRVQEGEVRQHANGALGIAALTIAVEDRDASLQRYQALLGADAVDGTGIRIGGTRLTLVDGKTGEAAAAALKARGEGPLAMAFAHQGGRAGDLDPARSHGAALRSVAVA